MSLMENTIPDMLESASHQFGDKAYLFEKTDSGWHGYSFSQARQLAKAFASALVKLQMLGPTAIIAEGRPSWVISELGVLITRNFSIPLSIKLGVEEISYRLKHSGARNLVCSRISLDKIIEALPSFGKSINVIYLDSGEEDLQRIQAATGLERGVQLFSYEEIIQIGTDEIDNPVHLAQLEAIEASVEPGDVATVCYTSGTTGNPKGIMLTHGNYFNNCSDSLEGFPIPFGLRMFVVLPIDHSFAHTIALYAALLRQFSLYFVDARGGSLSILRNIPLNLAEVQPDFMLTVPALTGNFMQKIIAGIRKKGDFIFGIFQAGLKARIRSLGNVWERPVWYQRILPWFSYMLAEVLIFKKVRKSLGNIGFTIGGGASLDIHQQEFFHAIGISVYQGYGLSEAAPVVSTNSIPACKLGTSGRVLPHVECTIQDDKGTILGPGEKGEICLRGKNIMAGYLHNPDATAEVMRGGWLHTGDLGYLDKDGFLTVYGREKALLIMSDGEKYSPEVMEDAIVASSEFIAQTMLWCDHQTHTVALITLREDLVEDWIKQHKASPEVFMAALISDFEAYTKETAYLGLFPRQWRPGSFAIINKAFNENDGTINSTMKMVRHVIQEKYRDFIDYQYSDSGKRSDNEMNRQYIRERYFKQ